MFDKAVFRQNFPEFADAATYPDATLDFWSGIGELFLVADRWKSTYDHGLQLFVAHNITLAAQNVAAASAGGAPGGTNGPVGSKSVGSASVSYDTAAIMETNAGEWNATSYGRVLLRLARMIGAGGLHV